MSRSAASGEPGFHFSPRPNRAGEIHWRNWSGEAFAEAGAADLPVLLSISAVWCHWCHVMDETSYSDQRVIDLVNSEFVPVRVDNDVRPDVNQRYNMGGWPTTAFLTPQGDILTGATYLPPDQLVAALRQVATQYRLNKPEIVGRVLEGRRLAGASIAAAAGTADAALVARLLGNVEQAYDPVNGGFGDAPKFPHPEALALLAEQSVIRQEPGLMEMARNSLARMAEGGTYDHVEGGFFRYSTTADWSIPHFEKMLEDHAGLISALALTGQGGILDGAAAYVETALRDPTGGLYGGSQDADEDYYALDAGGRSHARPPAIDRRVYTGWNCALAAAYLQADLRLGRPPLRRRAAEVLDAVFERYGTPEGGLLHTDGVGGQLGDQVWALLAATRAGMADRATRLRAHLESDFADPELGGYFDRSAEGGEGRLTEKLKPVAENAIAAIALHELGEPEAALRTLESVATAARRQGLTAAVFARALDRALRPLVKVTTTGEALRREAAAAYPYAVVEDGGDARAVVCVGTVCLAPVTSTAELAALVAGHTGA